MINLHDVPFGSPVTFPFSIPPEDTLAVKVYIGRTELAFSGTVQESSTPNVFFLTHTPASTGFFTYVINGIIIGVVNIVPRSIYSILDNIEGATIGSWSWDKKTGELTMFKLSGEVLEKFDVRDSLISSSRERL